MSCKSDWRWQGKCSSPDCCKGGRKRRRKRRRTRRKQRKHGGNGLKIIEKYKRTPAAAGDPLRAPRRRPGELASHTLISPNKTIKTKAQMARERAVETSNGFTLNTPLGKEKAKAAAKRFQREQIARDRAAEAEAEASAAQLEEELRPLRETWEDEEQARRERWAAARRGRSSRTSRTVSTTSGRTNDWGDVDANSNDEPYPGYKDPRRGPGMKFTKGGRRTRRRKRRCRRTRRRKRRRRRKKSRKFAR